MYIISRNKCLGSYKLQCLLCYKQGVGKLWAAGRMWPAEGKSAALSMKEKL